uniref:Steroid 5-alpha reductase C-terminal domain-containing protein n=1 Tax=Chenopodium quinoa TaxID=63459 RepID=A0A803LQ10_CHEQI
MAKVLDSHFLAITAIITVCYQFVFFVVTALLKFDKVTDFAGNSDFARGHMGSTSGVISFDEWGEDHRFDEMRANLGKLAVFWIFQAVWVWTVSLPVTIVNASDKDPSIRAVDIIGWIMWSIGFSIEATADQQKLSFKNSPSNRGKWCNVGVWKYSRHPNYFGEIFLWWGIFISSIPVLVGAEWLVIIGPVFLTLLLLFVSGLPLLEASADKKFGSVEEYRQYKKVTSPLVPLPPAVYGNLPLWFKKIFLFEFPIYSKSLPQEGYMVTTQVTLGEGLMRQNGCLTEEYDGELGVVSGFAYGLTDGYQTLKPEKLYLLAPQAVLLPFERDRVLAIPLSKRKLADVLCWDNEKNDIYSVRSAFRLISCQGGEEERCSDDRMLETNLEFDMGKSGSTSN